MLATKRVRLLLSVQIRVGQSEWSEALNLDAVGNIGVVKVKRWQPPDATTEVCMNTYVAWGGLTKVVTFSPRFLLFNNTERIIECSALSTAQSSTKPSLSSPSMVDEKIVLQPGDKSAFWPRSAEAQMTVS